MSNSLNKKLLKRFIFALFVLGVAYLIFSNYESSKERAQAFKVSDNKYDTLVLSKDSVKKILGRLPKNESPIEEIERDEDETEKKEAVAELSKAEISWKRSKNVFIYKSYNYDIEYPNGEVERVDEITYHTFDMDKKIVVQSSQLFEERFEMVYPFNDIYTETGLIGNAKTHVLKVNTLGCKEIWWSPDVPNLGYDYDGGKRIACYDLEIMYKKGNHYN
ncbi:MAG: hypothetical protein CMC96_00330 [Flavobacteriales bacterium]|nr:hypothetical protein [Flavobacteriales bacterium]|tara:strand:- start:63173 stop:63829 length:657 start_codon:yes stop_codon:yes gene_type:complete